MSQMQQAFYFGNTVLDRNRPRKMVFYGRVSTQHEAQLDALENQMQWYDDQIKYHPNWTVMDRYIDEGITGTLAKKRPSFMKMIEEAKHNKFDLIVTREVCRFARNTVDTLVITRELKNYGVEVYFVEDNIWTMDGDGELRLTIMATLAQEESRKISERVRAGQMVSRENGVLYGNGNIIGYDRVGKTYVINEEQAETIRTIYELYASGLGEKKIVTELSVRGCKDGRGHVSWSCTKISRILRNATYMGYICYNKSKTTDFLEKKRVKNLDESTIVMVKGDFEPIVTKELWEQCRTIRESRIQQYNAPIGQPKKVGMKPPTSMWAEKLRCRCGANFQRIRWRFNHVRSENIYGYQCYYRTRNANRTKLAEHGIDISTSCDQVSICEWKLELMAKRIFDQVFGDQGQAVLRACEMIENCSKTKCETERGAQFETESEIQKLKERLKSYTIMRADGDMTKEEYKALRRETQSKIDALSGSLSAKMSDTNQEKQRLQQIRKAMERAIDLSQPKVSEDLICEFVETITPVQQYCYRWKLNFGPRKERNERCDMMRITDTPILTFVIDYNSAETFRQNCGMDFRFRKNQWNDLKVEVYL